MALIKDSKGRKKNETPSGYERLLGSKELGQLISKLHATVISTGNELEQTIANKIKNSQGIAIADLNKFDRVFKEAKIDSSGKKHDVDVDCVISRNGKIQLIEIKDGDTFDTKKVAGEVESLGLAEDYLHQIKKIDKSKISKHFCSFNATSHDQIKKGAKSLLGNCNPMTGKELCEELGVNFEDIVEERKSQQKENKAFFFDEVEKIKKNYKSN